MQQETAGKDSDEEWLTLVEKLEGEPEDENPHAEHGPGRLAAVVNGQGQKNTVGGEAPAAMCTQILLREDFSVRFAERFHRCASECLRGEQRAAARLRPMLKIARHFLLSGW